MTRFLVVSFGLTNRDIRGKLVVVHVHGINESVAVTFAPSGSFRTGGERLGRDTVEAVPDGWAPGWAEPDAGDWLVAGVD